MNNPTPPSSLGPFSSKESFEKMHDPHHFSPQDRASTGRWWKVFLVMLLVSLGIGGLYRLHHDAGIGAAIIGIYVGLYWAFRKTQGPKVQTGYPVIRYRGHPQRKGRFFS